MRRFIPSLPALQAFEAAARHLNFTRAADELGMTQSGVSRHINGLEQFLGLRLFERAGSHLVLSDVGASYYEDVLQSLSRLEEVSIDAVRGRRADSALMIGSTPTLGATWLVPLMQRFAAQHPEIPFELTTIDDSEDIETSRVDIAIMRGAGQWHGRAHRLFGEELVVVSSPALLTVRDAPEELDFRAIPALQNASRPSLWLTWLRLSGVTHQGAIQGNRFSHSALMIEAALHGMGLAVVPALYVARDLASGSLVTPFGPPVRSGEAFWMVIAERKTQKRQIQTFRTWMQRQIL